MSPARASLSVSWNHRFTQSDTTAERGTWLRSDPSIFRIARSKSPPPDFRNSGKSCSFDLGFGNLGLLICFEVILAKSCSWITEGNGFPIKQRDTLTRWIRITKIGKKKLGLFLEGRLRDSSIRFSWIWSDESLSLGFWALLAKSFFSFLFFYVFFKRPGSLNTFVVGFQEKGDEESVSPDPLFGL